MTLPLRKRWEFVFLSRHRRGPKLSNNQVAHEVSVSRSTVEHWLGVYDATNDAIEEPRAGRGRSTSQQQDVKIVELAEAHEDMTSAGISGRLKRKGVEVSPRTVRLNVAGLESLKPSFRPLLNKKMPQKPLGLGKWTLQEDNDPKHRSVVAKKKTGGKKMEFVKWTGPHRAQT